MKIVIAGLSKYYQEIEKFLQAGVEVVCYIDNDVDKQNTVINGRQVYSPYTCPKDNIDYVIVTNMGYEKMLKLLITCGFSENQVIGYFYDHTDFYNYTDVLQAEKCLLHSMKCRISYLNVQLKNIKEENEMILGHYVYEIWDKFNKEKIRLPHVCSIEDTWRKIIIDRVSVSRYGDGEFQIILGNAKDIYQGNDSVLAERLKNILVSDLEGHIVAIASDYGSIDEYKMETRNAIRRYMTEKKRKQHYQLLDMDKQYYNAYISRPYVYYPQDEIQEAGQRFKMLKQIWNNEDVVIIEGDKTRSGVGNDLFDNAKSLVRIIAPNENAFSVYDEILSDSLKLCNKNQLILIALGPTATVLAYDLAKEGYWAVDIGHLDLEYEWYLKGEGFSYIANKYNNELIGDIIVSDIVDAAYDQSVIKVIGCLM